MYPAIDKEKQALEMTMRDVMDNLEDTSSYLALTSPDCLEILSIEPAGPDPITRKQRAKIHQHSDLILKKYA